MKIINSKTAFKKASKIIPLGSQTFSKSYKLYDPNFFPLFASKGKNQFIEDLDGNIFTDFVNGLGCVSIGYGIKEIDKNLKKKIDRGITFSLSHPIEEEVSRELKKIIPSAEMVRFGKNGTDVNSAAIRLARYYTGRKKIAVCGYHGWQDWYIGSTSMDGGIPREIKKLTDVFKFNDIESLKKLFKKNKYAAVILEPLSVELPTKKFLKEIRYLCTKYKTLLIFDEICTGFRVSIGGAQKLYKIIPDISTFGKAMANGYPISAVVGKKKIMKKMEEIFYSGTFQGETLSLEACKETIKYLKKNNSINKNIKKGNILIDNFNQIVKINKLDHIIKLSGHPSWPFLVIKHESENLKNQIKTYFMQEYVLNKILFIGSFNINASHTKQDILNLLKVSKKIIFSLKKNIDRLENLIIPNVAKPLFRVRN